MLIGFRSIMSVEFILNRSLGLATFWSVFRIHDILIRIRICESVPLSNWSGFWSFRLVFIRVGESTIWIQNDLSRIRIRLLRKFRLRSRILFRIRQPWSPPRESCAANSHSIRGFYQRSFVSNSFGWGLSGSRSEMIYSGSCKKSFGSDSGSWSTTLVFIANHFLKVHLNHSVFSHCIHYRPEQHRILKSSSCDFFYHKQRKIRFFF